MGMDGEGVLEEKKDRVWVKGVRRGLDQLPDEDDREEREGTGEAESHPDDEDEEDALIREEKDEDGGIFRNCENGQEG